MARSSLEIFSTARNFLLALTLANSIGGDNAVASNVNAFNAWLPEQKVLFDSNISRVDAVLSTPKKIILPHDDYADIKKPPQIIFRDFPKKDTDLEQLPPPEDFDPASIPIVDTVIYNKDLTRYQPDKVTCVPTSVLMMLNYIPQTGSQGENFIWTPSVTYRSVMTIKEWTQAHDTLVDTGLGSDLNGWRNALNFFGWGNYQDPQTRVYEVFSFDSFDEAFDAAIKAMALYNKPVGFPGWGGSHAQFITGNETVGDPAKEGYVTNTLNITDPLQKNGLRNATITPEELKNGSLTWRFRPYVWKDSPFIDLYPRTPSDKPKPAWIDWYGRFNILAPAR